MVCPMCVMKHAKLSDVFGGVILPSEVVWCLHCLPPRESPAIQCVLGGNVQTNYNLAEVDGRLIWLSCLHLLNSSFCTVFQVEVGRTLNIVKNFSPFPRASVNP